MTVPFPQLDEVESDALAEIVNIGVGRAAHRLADMVGDTVQLSVPRVELLIREVAASLLDQRGSTGLVSVGQDFDGAFAGQALLLFPETNSLELVRAVVGDGMALDEIIDLEQGALAEIGNIILNGCLVCIANMLRLDLTMSLPRVLRGSGRHILAVGGEGGREAEPVLFLTIEFGIASRNISGYIALLMDLPSLAVLRELIARFIDSIAQGVDQ